MPQKKHARRERRIATRKKQIIEAAVEVFLDKGYHGATTKEIADAADVSEGTIYNYFESKEDLLMEAISNFAELEERRAFFDKALDLDFREFLAEFSRQRQGGFGSRVDVLQAIFPALLSSPEIRKRYNEEIVQPALDMFEAHLRKRIERGQLKPIDDLPLVARILTGASLGIWLLLVVGDPVVLNALQNPEQLLEVGIRTLYDQFLPDGNP